jgi:ABC-2 type transport system permease protein
MLRADFYRLLQSKSFWITQALVLVFVVVTIKTGSVGHIGIDAGQEVQQAAQSYGENLDGVTAVSVVQSMSDILVYFILPLIVFIIGTDFTKGTYKNILTVGVSRYKYFFSKLTSFTIVLTIQLIMIYLVAFITGVIVNTTGDITIDFMKNTVAVLGVQLIFLLAITVLASALLFTTKNNVVSIIFTIVFPLALSILHLLNPNVRLYEMLDFSTALKLATSLDFDLLKYCLMGALSTIVLGNVVIAQVFKRQEL